MRVAASAALVDAKRPEVRSHAERGNDLRFERSV